MNISLHSPLTLGRVSLLRSLLSLKDDASKTTVHKLLLQALHDGVTDTSFLDAPLSVVYAR